MTYPVFRHEAEVVLFEPELPLEQQMAIYERWLYDLGLSQKTVKAYIGQLGRCAEWIDRRGLSLSTIGGPELVEYQKESPGSTSSRRQLRTALKYYWEMTDRRRAPVRAIHVPPKPRMFCRALEEDDAKALARAAVVTWPEGAATLLGLYLALRREEIAKARWQNFDDDMEWYTVHEGKGGVTATIPVHEIVRARFRLRRPEPATGYIFPGRTGMRDHVNPATVWGWVKQVAVQAGIGEITTHQLRHTALATANDNTSDLRAVMEFARHRRPEITAGYTRTTRRKLEMVVGSLDYL